jgi:2-dehydro-3-deoxygalactonokinase
VEKAYGARKHAVKPYAAAPVIAVDWGTSSFRAYRLDAHGAVLEARSAEKGIIAVPPGPRVLEEVIGAWLDDAPIVMSGMVGSRQGWVEVPYVECPVALDDLSRSVKQVRWESRSAWIVPGVSCRHAVPDVMRGEEVQVLGAGRDGLICLPGTHSKWVEVRGGRIERFSTSMTGEVYAVLKQHSILGRMMEEGTLRPDAFGEGVRRSGDKGGLLHHLFGVRSRGLMGELPPAASASYLSGLLIGHELRMIRQESFFLLGEPALVAVYEHAAAQLGMKASALDPLAGTRALFRLGAMLASKEAS